MRRSATAWRAGLIAVIFCVGGGCHKAPSPAAKKKMLIIGADGMDPRLVRKLIDQGRMPNFAKLEKQGGFVPLETSIPPQSPVAWSNFITGADPGVHGIFDFIHRDPSKPASPYFSTNRVVSKETRKPWPVGSQYQIPWIKSSNELLRKGTPFWDYLDEQGINAAMYRLPANYPPAKARHGYVKVLDDMGVPDALGSQGTFQHFTSAFRPETKGGEGYKLRLRAESGTDGLVGRIRGPLNEFEQGTDTEMSVTFRMYADAKNPVAKLMFDNAGVVSDEHVEVLLAVGEWSPWQEVTFLKTPVGPNYRTMVRFYLQAVRPEVNLYVTPLNFVPTAPETDFSAPEDLCEDIGRTIGPFYTKGFAEDFNARKQDIFDDEEYRKQAAYVLDERMKILDYALDHYRSGLLFVYFSSSDLQAHIFWWDSDHKHPKRSEEEAKRYHRVVEQIYVRIDEALGRCIKRLGDDTTVIVMSDHGFGRFERGFGLNKWLQENGYLSCADESNVAYADWSKTSAYGLGLNALYLNLKGREVHGSVAAADRDKVLKEISEKLLGVRDPKRNNAKVIARVYPREKYYHGPEMKNAPDLIVGYAADYRASWNTCLGDVDADVLMDNNNAWSADHCIAHDLVPGVLLCNRRIEKSAPSLIDLAPTILEEFGIAKPASMTGSSIFHPAARVDAGHSTTEAACLATK